MMSRMIERGKRRSEEMFESASTVRDAGFEPLMATAIAKSQAGIARLAAAGVFKDLPNGIKGVVKDGNWRQLAAIGGSLPMQSSPQMKDKACASDQRL